MEITMATSQEQMATNTNRFTANAEGIYQSNPFSDRTIGAYLHPYAFTLRSSFSTYAQSLQELFRFDKDGADATATNMRSGQISADALYSSATADNATFTKFSVADTSLGGNEAINCRWGFGRDDDIIHPMNALMGQPELGGIGRVYMDMYQTTQQLLHITVGVPEFQKLWEFYSTAVDADLCSDVNSGNALKIGRLFGSAIGGAAKLAFTAFTWPYHFTVWLADFLSPNDRVTRYYDLDPAMPLYYRYVNSILVHLCCNLGWYPNAWDIPDAFNPKAGTGGTTSGSQANTSYMELLKSSGANNNGEPNEAALPGFLQGCGPNIYKIISKRDYRLGLNLTMQNKDTDDFLSRAARKAAPDGFWDIFTQRARASATGADKYISFRINKSTDSSEAISNSTGQSTVAQFFNSQAAAGRDRTFSSGGSILNNVPVIGSILKGASDVVMGVATKAGFAGLAAAVMTGSGFLDIPDIWLSSSFSKNYNFSFQLRAPAADNLSITQSLYVPLAMLLPLACPRSVGLNAYTSPFLVKAYCKGMFAIPLGIR
jgi:hypothetical protein